MQRQWTASGEVISCAQVLHAHAAQHCQQSIDLQNARKRARTRALSHRPWLPELALELPSCICVKGMRRTSRCDTPTDEL